MIHMKFQALLSMKIKVGFCFKLCCVTVMTITFLVDNLLSSNPVNLQKGKKNDIKLFMYIFNMSATFCNVVKGYT